MSSPVTTGSVQKTGTDNQITSGSQSSLSNLMNSGATSSASSSTLTPWAASSGLLQGILGNVGNVNPNVSPQEQDALAQLSANASAGNPFAGGIGNVANSLLAGGNAGAQAPAIAGNLQQYQQQLNPYLQSSFLNPMSTPGFGDALSALNSDISNQINGQFAGAGRDLSGLNTQTLARGLSQGEGQLIANQYNQNVANQLGAMGAGYGAGNTTAGLLTGLNQQGLANQQAGIPAADAALQAQQWGPMQQLAVAAQQRSIPLQTLAAQMGLVLPATQAFGTQTGTGSGTTSGMQSGSSSGQSYGNTCDTMSQLTQQQSPLWQQLAGGLLGGGALLGGNQGLLKALGIG